MSEKPLVNVADVPLTEWGRGEKNRAKLGRMGNLIGAKQLGCMLHVLAPGKSAFPYHCHHANEELYVVLEGSGEFRLGDKTYPVRAGDVAVAPAGGVETAHHIVNTGTDELKFLCISTMHSPELAEYPNSGKFGVYSLTGSKDGRWAFRFINRKDNSLDYWEGE